MGVRREPGSGSRSFRGRPDPDDAFDDILWTGIVGVDAHLGHFVIERLTLSEQLDQPAANVSEQQRAGSVESDPVKRSRHANSEPDDAVTPQRRAGSRG